MSQKPLIDKVSQKQSVDRKKLVGESGKAQDQSDDSVLSYYLRDINRVPLLTREEEIDCATRARSGDTTAKEYLVRANLRFVVNVAKKYQNQGLPLSDLISEGNIGLMNAVDRFDVTRGYHFISYAQDLEDYHF